MIALVEGAIRQRTPNEIALVAGAGRVHVDLSDRHRRFVADGAERRSLHEGYLGIDHPLKSLGTDVPTLVALLVCLIPTTIGALLAAIGIAGMDRALRANILAKSGKAVEVAGDVDTLLLDKTGTITIGNRKATRFVPFDGFSATEIGRLAAQASAADQTPEGKSIVELFHQHDGATAAMATASGSAGRTFRGLHCPNPNERRRSARWPPNSQRCARFNRSPRQTAKRLGAGQHRIDGRPVWPARVPRRCWSATEIGSPAWSCWKIFSSPASPNGSNGCGGWACAP